MKSPKIFPETALKKVDVIAAEGYVNTGCYVLNGTLVPAINSVRTVKSITIKPTAAWYSVLTKKYLVFANNYMYYSTDVLNALLYTSFAAKYPSFVEVRTTTDTQATIFGDTTYYVASALGLTYPYKGAARDCVFKNGRYFGINNSNSYKINWSGEGGINDWTENISGAGWTFVQYDYGEILNLVVYKEKIVIVREYGLNFMSAYGTPENFKISYPESRLPQIYKNTAAAVGDKLIFLTYDGLYFYDGNKVEKSTMPLAEDIQSPTFISCAKGKYFLCGISKSLGRKAVLVYDSILNSTYLIDVDATALVAGPRIFAYSADTEYELTEGGEYSFESGEIDFSSSANKVLKEVKISGGADVRLEVSNGVISRIVGGLRGKFRPNMRGKSFKIKVYSSDKISGISAIAEVLNEV